MKDKTDGAEDAVEKITDIIMEHLSQFPVEKQKKIIRDAINAASKRRTGGNAV